MLTEVVEFIHLFESVLYHPQARVVQWAPIYQYYRCLDQVLVAATDAIEYALPRRMDEPALMSTQFYPDGLTKWVTLTNDNFASLDEAVVHALHELSGITRHVGTCLLVPNKEVTDLLRFHLHPMSLWYVCFVEDFISGRISDDGLMLRHAALKTTQHAKKRILSFDIQAMELMVDQSWDISTHDLRLALCSKEKIMISRLHQSREALRVYLLAHCTMADLL